MAQNDRGKRRTVDAVACLVFDPLCRLIYPLPFFVSLGGGIVINGAGERCSSLVIEIPLPSTPFLPLVQRNVRNSLFFRHNPRMETNCATCFSEEGVLGEAEKTCKRQQQQKASLSTLLFPPPPLFFEQHHVQYMMAMHVLCMHYDDASEYISPLILTELDEGRIMFF